VFLVFPGVFGGFLGILVSACFWVDFDGLVVLVCFELF